MTAKFERTREVDHEAIHLIAELMNASWVLGSLWSSLRELMDPADYPGEDLDLVLLEMFAGSSMPVLRKDGLRHCRQTAKLLAAIRERVMDEMRLTVEIAERREKLGNQRRNSTPDDGDQSPSSHPVS